MNTEEQDILRWLIPTKHANVCFQFQGRVTNCTQLCFFQVSPDRVDAKKGAEKTDGMI